MGPFRKIPPKIKKGIFWFFFIVFSVCYLIPILKSVGYKLFRVFLIDWYLNRLFYSFCIWFDYFYNLYNFSKQFKIFSVKIVCDLILEPSWIELHAFFSKWLRYLFCDWFATVTKMSLYTFSSLLAIIIYGLYLY